MTSFYPTIKIYSFIILGLLLLRCQSNLPSKQEVLLENFIRSIPKEERTVFQNYRRIWLYLANTFANGDLPSHDNFYSLFHYNINEEKFLLRRMLTKDSLWNPYAIECLDTLIKSQYQQNNYQSAGLKLEFQYSETDSGSKYNSRFKGIIHYANTSKYVQKDYFPKYVHEIYPIPLMLDLTAPKKAKTFFFVDFDEVQALDSIYNEFAFQILYNVRWFSQPLMDTILFRKFIPFEEKNIFLQEYYRIVKLQQMCNMPEEDWQHRSVRPVLDALIIILAKQLFEHPNPWEITGLSPELIHLGFITLANQWTNISPWLHHYISSSLQNIFHFYYPESQIILKLPAGKNSIRRKSNAEPILIAPIKLIYKHPKQPIQEIWISLPITPKNYPTLKILKKKFHTLSPNR